MWLEAIINRKGALIILACAVLLGAILNTATAIGRVNDSANVIRWTMAMVLWVGFVVLVVSVVKEYQIDRRA